MIHAIRTVTVGDNESIIDKPIILYRGDREVEIEFTLLGNEFRFSDDGNVFKSANASHGQLVLNTPSGENMFSEVSKCHEGNVVFIITKEMIDEFIEVGFYSFQIRLYDGADMKSRMTIPPVLNGIDIRNPIAAEDETNVVDQGIVDYARVYKDQSNEELPTFDCTGAYNKTEWVHHDVITENKMNKIEDALYSINANIKESDVVMLNALDNIKKDADKYVKEHIAEVEADVEEFERNLNVGVEQFKIDVNAHMAEVEADVEEFKIDVNEHIDEIEADVEELERNLNVGVEQFKIDVNSQLASHTLQLDNNKKNNRINVKDHGAIGDWSSHPASEFYSSLEELQKDYPNAQSLNDEMDTLALEKVLTSSAKTVYIPYGGYKLNRGNFSIGSDRSIVGDSKGVTQITYSGNDEYIFVLTGNNVTMKDFRITAPFTSGEKGTKTTTSCINVSGRTNNTFSDLYIVGFDRALNFNIGSWIQYVNRVRIQNCNYGIYGSSEFNNICISQCSITYCDVAIYAAAGRNIAVQMCDIERNNTGVYKTNLGDISIRDNYFEFNTSGNIEVAWGTNSVDMAIIDGNTFFTTSSGEPMIKYHTRADARIIVTNNNFHCHNLNEGTQVKCLVPTHNNTQVRPYFKNNFLRQGYIIGVDSTKINSDEFYKNGNHVYYSSNYDLSAVMTSSIQTIRTPFDEGGVITLPSFRSLEDNTQCFKMIAFTSPGSDIAEDDYMAIDSTGKAIYGTRKIYPNQIYSIYFIRVNGNTEEIMVVKG